MLPKENRLQAKDIKKIYSFGNKYKGEYGMLIKGENTKLDNFQISFVVSKKIGNAVQRHHMTRLLREISRTNLKGYKDKFVYVAFKYSNEYAELEKDFTNQLKKINPNS